MSDISFHPLADIFPLTEGEEFATFKADIAENGLRESIWLWQGQIVDGRNRYRACRELGIEPSYREWDGRGDLLTFIISMNLHRRHLSESQRAMVGARIASMRQGERTDLSENSVMSQPQAAQLLNISPDLIGFAKKVQEEGTTELGRAVDMGNVAVSLAAKVAGFEDKEQERFLRLVSAGEKPKEAYRQVTRSENRASVLPSGKYRVLYADPPWQYGNSGVINDDNYGRAERHYPTMSIQQLSDMGQSIKELTDESAVLFLWTTSPMLEDAFRVVNAWGFQYKTSFVWDKVRHNFGHYNSVRHEFLLVCTRGSCTPDSDTKYDSVQSIERDDKHSAKPAEFRQIIDTLYTWGQRIELFARERVDRWDAWGNECS